MNMADLLSVCIDQLHEGYVTKLGLLNGRRDGECTVGWAKSSEHKPTLTSLSFDLFAGLGSEFGTFKVQAIHLGDVNQ